MVSIPLNDNDIHSVGNEMLEGSKIQSYEKKINIENINFV